jgi:hypothetical protein
VAADTGALGSQCAGSVSNATVQGLPANSHNVAVAFHAITRIDHQPEQGTAPLVQAVYYLCNDDDRHRPAIDTVCSPPYGHGVRREYSFRLGMIRFRRMP